MKRLTEDEAQPAKNAAKSLNSGKKNEVQDKLSYQSGFGNHFASEARSGTLPAGQNSPQRVAHGLYAEQLSGSSFTSPRHENQRSWLYRIRPSVLHSPFKLIDRGLFLGKPEGETPVSPEQWRWDPLPFPEVAKDFVEGLVTVASNGNASSWRGCAAHLYAINKSMKDKFFYDADGDLLFVPESGDLLLLTEFGQMSVSPGEIAVIQRGIRFQVQLPNKRARGYVCENYGLPFRLPTLGLIGSNGLADPRHFLTPSASYEDREGQFDLVTKFQNQLWQCSLDHSPLDVVAWHGNYAPYKYDLSLFQVINSVSFDHSDPSIFTVLTSPSEINGVANVDFVIFPPRWTVSEHTFRPPYYHRNVMSEFMGLVRGVYDAKQTGFEPGGASLHNCLSAHGPDATTYEKAISDHLSPKHSGDALAFMFESSLVFQPTPWSMKTDLLQSDYLDCWGTLKKHFS
jgi:homogentisate 1,2-dioxygenase